jgi:hypothetical protein
MKQWEKIHGCIKLEEKRERTKSLSELEVM